LIRPRLVLLKKTELMVGRQMIKSLMVRAIDSGNGSTLLKRKRLQNGLKREDEEDESKLLTQTKFIEKIDESIRISR